MKTDEAETKRNSLHGETEKSFFETENHWSYRWDDQLWLGWLHDSLCLLCVQYCVLFSDFNTVIHPTLLPSSVIVLPYEDLVNSPEMIADIDIGCWERCSYFFPLFLTT